MENVVFYGYCLVIEVIINYFIVHTVPTSAVCDSSCVSSNLL